MRFELGLELSKLDLLMSGYQFFPLVTLS